MPRRLSPREQHLLDLLQSRPDQPIPTLELAAALGWTYADKRDAQNAVRELVYRLRTRLGEQGGHIQAQRRRGVWWSTQPQPLPLRPKVQRRCPSSEPKTCAICGVLLAEHWRCAGCGVLGHAVPRYKRTRLCVACVRERTPRGMDSYGQRSTHR